MRVELGPSQLWGGLSLPVLGRLLPPLPRPRWLMGGRAAGPRTVLARRSVVLCAGAYESPHLLLKSGVGDAGQLAARGVSPRLHLPGVGRNLQDHPIFGLKYRLGSQGGAWAPATVTKLWLLYPSLILGWLGWGRGALASSGCDIGYFGCSDDSQAACGRPDLQVHGMVTAGDPPFYLRFLKFLPFFLEDIGDSSDYSIWAQGLMLAPTLLHAKARGSVTLHPANVRSNGTYDGRGPPHIAYEAFGDDEDLAKMVEGVRRVQTIMRQPSMRPYSPTLLHSRSLAADFGADTDAYWREYIKRLGFVVYHPGGTCAMGRGGSSADAARGVVVDSQLRVLGVERLRVADASVMPTLPSGNTQVPTAAIAIQLVRLLQGL